MGQILVPSLPNHRSVDFELGAGCNLSKKPPKKKIYSKTEGGSGSLHHSTTSKQPMEAERSTNGHDASAVRTMEWNHTNAQRTRGLKRRRQEQTSTIQHEAETSSLFYYDNLRKLLAQGTVRGETIEGSSIIKTPGENVRLMHVSALLGYTRGGADPIEALVLSTKAAIMAMHHFNNRIDTMVHDLKQQLTDSNGNECDLKMTMDFYDTERQTRTGSSILAKQIHSTQYPYQTTAVMGAVRSAVSVPLAVLNTARSIPQISYASTSTTLDNRGIYSLFGRTIPSNDGDAQAVIEYYAELGVERLGILYVRDDYGTAYRLALEKAATYKSITTASAAIIWDQSQSNENGLRDGIKDAIASLKATGYRYMMGIIYSPHLEISIEEATAGGIMGPGYVWIFGDGIVPRHLEGLRYPTGSAEANAIQGLGLISVGSAGEHVSSKFVENWNSFDDLEEFPQFFESKSVRVEFDKVLRSVGPSECADHFALSLPEFSMLSQSSRIISNFKEISASQSQRTTTQDLHLTPSWLWG